MHGTGHRLRFSAKFLQTTRLLFFESSEDRNEAFPNGRGRLETLHRCISYIKWVFAAGSYIALSTGCSCRCMAMEKPNRLPGSPSLRTTLSGSRLKAEHPNRKAKSSDSPQVVPACMAPGRGTKLWQRSANRCCCCCRCCCCVLPRWVCRRTDRGILDSRPLLPPASLGTHASSHHTLN